jgi:hypothetical protein
MGFIDAAQEVARLDRPQTRVTIHRCSAVWTHCLMHVVVGKLLQ